MSTTDYLINFILIGLVLLQIRDRPLTMRSLIRPVVLVGAAAAYYLKAVPTAGNDVLLDVVLGGAGLILGTACGLTTRVSKGGDGLAHSKAGIFAALFWVLGIGTRLAFEEYSTHGGAASIMHFSVVHQITGENAWVAALVIMALVEVLSRLAVLRIRATRALSESEHHESRSHEPSMAL